MATGPNIYPMSDVQQTHRESATGRTVGKFLMKTGSEQDWPQMA